MSKSARSVFAFSVYLFFLGTILIVIPNVLLNLFKLPETNEPWIRVVGVTILIIGFYYFHASKNEMKNFFKWTVYARSSVIIFFIIFVLLDLAPKVLILFGVLDAVAALWTHLSLRSEKI